MCSSRSANNFKTKTKHERRTNRRTNRESQGGLQKTWAQQPSRRRGTEGVSRHPQGQKPEGNDGSGGGERTFQSLLVSTVVMCCLVFALSIIPFYLNQGDGQAEAVRGSQGPSAGSSEVEPDFTFRRIVARTNPRSRYGPDPRAKNGRSSRGG